MAKVVDFFELRDKRTEAASEALIDGYSKLDPDDPKYFIKARGLSEIHKQLVTEDANREVEFHNRVQEEQEEKESRRSRWIEVCKVAGGILVGIGTIANAISKIFIYKDVTSYEKDVELGAPGAFRTLGDREVVQDTMRHGFFEKTKN